jgi:subtilisin family serine protease
LKAADADLFMEQWAFKHIGLHDREDDFKGRNVQIGIFDTWPEELIDEDSTVKPLSWVSEPSLLEPEIINHFRLLEPEARDYDLSSHGLFSAGLAHAIAPEAKIQIYRVLNKNNKGALFSIMRATFEFILDFTSEETADDDQQKLGAVINMSLGIRVPPEAAGITLPAEVLSFRDLLLAARCAGIVVVAASGNNSAKAQLPEPANLPANWPENIGVAASNFYRKMSCFSNQGNIAAPGGDGVQSKHNPDGCIGAIGLCEPDRDCEYAIIGPVLQEGGNTGFAFWNGTSFSSPMVAALAACVVEKGQGRFSPDKVRSILECGATDPDPEGYLGAGIINIPRTMDCCPVDETKPEVPDQQPDYDDKEQSAV